MNKDILNYKQSLGFPKNYENMVHSQRGLWKAIFFSLLAGGFFPTTTSNHVLSFETNGILELWPDNAQPSGFSHQFIPLTTLKQISIRQLGILFSHISIVTLVKKNTQTVRYIIWSSTWDYPLTDNNLDNVNMTINGYKSMLHE